MNTNNVNAEQAREVMSVFLNAPRVQRVQVVGSVARNRCGNDLDLVLVVNVFDYASFACRMNDWFGSDCNEDDDYYAGFKQQRFNVALSILGLPPLAYAWLLCATREFSIDLHLMPEGWQEHIDQVQAHLPHDDPNFVRNIANDAVDIRSDSRAGVNWAKW